MHVNQGLIKPAARVAAGRREVAMRREAELRTDGVLGWARLGRERQLPQNAVDFAQEVDLDFDFTQGVDLDFDLSQAIDLLFHPMMYL